MSTATALVTATSRWSVPCCRNSKWRRHLVALHHLTELQLESVSLFLATKEPSSACPIQRHRQDRQYSNHFFKLFYQYI